ncbi:MAG TPA: N-acetylmannosamine-6-phosphate 2-epimerase [Clostridiales bacterium]|nr:N-acetylmannosamine-6-phosphate 2-epimerase [Clostridiales bacterium]
MKRDIFLKAVHKGLIVSCQALKGEPLYGSHIMARMAIAAESGGAKAIRCNSVSDLKAIKKAVNLPLIGLIKRQYKGYDPYITPTIQEVDQLVDAGADVIAVDSTNRKHPHDLTAVEFIDQIKTKYDIPILADISVLQEGIAAEQAGADYVSTTMSGYTPYSPNIQEPDFELMQALPKVLRIPVFAEGRIFAPKQAKRCLDNGAYAVIIGAAITRPEVITRRFVENMK